MIYTIVLTPDPESGAVTVSVPAMPGVLTWGSTVEEALASAREAIELHLESYVERGRPFPVDRPVPGKQTVSIEVMLPDDRRRHSA